MVRQLIRERLQSQSQARHLLGRHTARDVEREHDGQRARFALPLFELEEGDRLLNAVRKYPEIFLTQILNRLPVCIQGRNVDRHQIGVHTNNVFGFLFFGKDLAWSFSVRRRRGSLGQTRRSKSHQEEEGKGNVRRNSRNGFWHL